MNKKSSTNLNLSPTALNYLKDKISKLYCLYLKFIIYNKYLTKTQYVFADKIS